MESAFGSDLSRVPSIETLASAIAQGGMDLDDRLDQVSELFRSRAEAFARYPGLQDENSPKEACTEWAKAMILENSWQIKSCWLNHRLGTLLPAEMSTLSRVKAKNRWPQGAAELVFAHGRSNRGDAYLLNEMARFLLADESGELQIKTHELGAWDPVHDGDRSVREVAEFVETLFGELSPSHEACLVLTGGYKAHLLSVVVRVARLSSGGGFPATSIHYLHEGGDAELVTLRLAGAPFRPELRA